MTQDTRSNRQGPAGQGGFSLAPPKIELFWLGLYIGLIIACIVVMSAWPELRAFAFVALVVTIALMPIGLRGRSSDETGGGLEHMDRLAASIEAMTRESGLSEGAKRVLHRREERELLRREIQRDIADSDWDAATVLVKELAERFGYRADAEEFRGRIERARVENMDRAVGLAVSELDRLIGARRWTDAFAEAARITRLHPDSPLVEGLRQRVDDARARYKAELERRFLMAAQRDEIEVAMQLLKELDSYLSEADGERFREVARGVIGKARDNLGVRFKLALQDRNWAAALEVGERIVADFPNTRMADEVREMMDSLRARAAGGAGAGVRA